MFSAVAHERPDGVSSRFRRHVVVSGGGFGWHPRWSDLVDFWLGNSEFGPILGSACCTLMQCLSLPAKSRLPSWPGFLGRCAVGLMPRPDDD